MEEAQVREPWGLEWILWHGIALWWLEMLNISLIADHPIASMLPFQYFLYLIPNLNVQKHSRDISQKCMGKMFELTLVFRDGKGNACCELLSLWHMLPWDLSPKLIRFQRFFPIKALESGDVCLFYFKIQSLIHYMIMWRPVEADFSQSKGLNFPSYKVLVYTYYTKGLPVEGLLVIFNYVLEWTVAKLAITELTWQFQSINIVRRDSPML